MCTQNMPDLSQGSFGERNPAVFVQKPVAPCLGPSLSVPSGETVVLSCVILNKCKKDRESQKDVEEAAHTRDVDQIGTNPRWYASPAEARKKLMRQEEMPGQTNTANTRLVQQLNQWK